LPARLDLVCLRDQAGRATPLLAEQKVFTQLWADVAALLKKAEASPKEDSK
jgi:hypothetical protein